MPENNINDSKDADVATEAHSGAVSRRSFMRAVGATTSAAVVFSHVGVARAGNGWTMGLDGIPPEKLKEMYTLMLTSRWWEDGIKEVILSGKAGAIGSGHLSTGEEASAIGMIAALNPDDYIASNHRGHAHLIGKGGDLNKMSAEIFFKETGYNKGFGGSMHMTDISKGILGMNGIVGPSYLLAAGAAYSAKVRKTKQVAVAFGGDGAVNNGWYYSALRNAALYKLPLIAVVENNGYQIAHRQELTNSLINLHNFGAGLEIQHEAANGMDALAVYAVAKRAVDRARAGEGPTLIETKTYRYYDHSGLAGAKPGVLGAFGLPYRSDMELRAWLAEDPIPKLRTQLIGGGILTAAQADAIEADIKKRVAQSIEFAQKSPSPAREAGLENVFASTKVAATQFLKS
jgi:pyruvate dehydrogenase E1 component alpha subunit